jgi:hypothetical protein
MRGDDAKEVCPQIHLVQVPVARGKADLNTYRNAGSEVMWDFAFLFVRRLKLITCIHDVLLLDIY